MNFIVHRTNTIEDLDRVKDPNWGCEIDIRSHSTRSGSLHLAHDPWSTGISFEDWISEFKRRRIQGTLILNTKEDGLETRVFEIIEKAGLINYFFLDTCLPTLVRWTSKGKKNFAVRHSTFEPPEFCNRFAGLADWCWIDCFDQKLPDQGEVKSLKSIFNLCMVSPELQGATPEATKQFASLASICENVCTKNPEWYLS